MRVKLDHDNNQPIPQPTDHKSNKQVVKEDNQPASQLDKPEPGPEDVNWPTMPQVEDLPDIEVLLLAQPEEQDTVLETQEEDWANDNPIPTSGNNPIFTENEDHLTNPDLEGGTNHKTMTTPSIGKTTNEVSQRPVVVAEEGIGHGIGTHKDTKNELEHEDIDQPTTPQIEEDPTDVEIPKSTEDSTVSNNVQLLPAELEEPGDPTIPKGTQLPVQPEE